MAARRPETASSNPPPGSLAPPPLTRRAAVGFASLVLAGPALALVPPAVATVRATSLHQEVEFGATRERIYDLLLDAKAFSAMTGDAADVGPAAGQAFSLFGGRITGRNIELVSPERIVQAWRSRSWAAGVYSIVRFALAPRGARTLLVLDHTGFPDGDGENLAGGWREHYWEPLGKLLG